MSVLSNYGADKYSHIEIHIKEMLIYLIVTRTDLFLVHECLQINDNKYKSGLDDGRFNTDDTWSPHHLLTSFYIFIVTFREESLTFESIT